MIRAGFLFIVVFLAAIVQVSVVPLFPLQGALADVGILTLITIAFGAGPRAAMVCLPILAVFVSFASDRAPGLVLLAYLPLLPVAALMEDAPLPLGRYLRVVLTIVIAGFLSRLIFSLGAFADGARFLPGAMVTEVLLPGVTFDLILATILYMPLRLSGWAARSLTLRRTGWFAA
jgi:hypothetical protein